MSSDESLRVGYNSRLNDFLDILAREDGILPVIFPDEVNLLVFLSDPFSSGTLRPLLRALFSTSLSLEGKFFENRIAFGSRN